MTMPTVTHRYSVSYVTQGKYRFYTLTIPSDVLATSCFATTPDEDPIRGFQRVLDVGRAKEIARYIDSATGPIPNSIVLSAQPSANLRIIGKGKTLEFSENPHAFLILDGQHRVYGFRIATTPLRVPVVIFNGLSVLEESRLFIDINTKQRPVSTSLLLAIKNLAGYESTTEALLKGLFERFNKSPQSPLIGLMSSTQEVAGKVSRVTFNAAIKPLLPMFEERDDDDIYAALSSYIAAVQAELSGADLENAIVRPVIFRAFLALFRDIAPRVKDRYSGSYTPRNFKFFLEGLFTKTTRKRLAAPGASYMSLYEDLSKQLRRSALL
jgi:DGQHR domain-containing protein